MVFNIYTDILCILCLLVLYGAIPYHETLRMTVYLKSLDHNISKNLQSMPSHSYNTYTLADILFEGSNPS